jgi:hypothetical protein
MLLMQDRFLCDALDAGAGRADVDCLMGVRGGKALLMKGNSFIERAHEGLHANDFA